MKLARHSKPSNKKGIFKQGKSRSQANIAGYEKRLAQKAKSTPTIDLYEHIPEKTRRSKLTLDLGRDEEFEADDEEREELKARLIGEFEDGEEIPSDDDEELDSDAAPEETDQERFAEGDNDEFIDLLDVLDGKGEIDIASDSENASNHPAEELKSDDDSASEEILDFDPSDDEEMPEALDQLNDFVSNLDVTSRKRKAAVDPSEVGASTDARARKRRLVKESTEAGAENEFRARSSGLKLNIDDLLAPLASQSSALQSLKASAKVLASSSSKAKTLSAPLPQRTQERLDRHAAYEQTKEEVNKWSDTMKHIRDAEHLSFPLQSQSTGRVSNLELTAKFKPSTALEISVDALLKSAKLRDEDIHHTEEAMLQLNQLSVEEIAQRRGELRKMRELTFRAEVKARRVGKIKSKTYRRIKRKEKERLGEKINEDNPGDSDDEEEEEETALNLKGKGKANDIKAFEQQDLVQDDMGDSGDEEEENGSPPVPKAVLTLKGKEKANDIKAFEQRDLVALAFAGDNVVQNFEEAKNREIASDAPREVDTTIPGWGSWGGAGVRKLPPKPQRIKKVAGIDPTTRADFNKKYIIISEKRDKKAGKYLVKDLPYPYTSKAQFERAMENPLGAEWNTRVAFQRGTLPKVVKKPGVIINPLEKLTL